MSEPEQIVNTIARQTKNLLGNHWADIDDFRDGDEKIKVGFSHYITYQGQERIVETTISFGKRMKDTAVERMDTQQMKLPLTTAALIPAPIPASDPANFIKVGKRRGRRPGSKNKPKSVLAAKLSSEPKPDDAA